MQFIFAHETNSFSEDKYSDAIEFQREAQRRYASKEEKKHYKELFLKEKEKDSWKEQHRKDTIKAVENKMEDLLVRKV